MQRETDSQQPGGKPGAPAWLAAAFEQGLSRAIESMAGPDVAGGLNVRSSPADPHAWSAWASPAWRRFALENAPGATVWAGCSSEAASAIGRLVAADPSLPDEQCREAYLEILSQTAAAASDLISLRLGRRVSFSLAESAEQPPDAAHAVHIECALGGATRVIAVAMNAALMQSFDAAPDSSQAPAPEAPSTVTHAPGGEPPAGASPPPPRNMDLLLEVELPVCVTFGRTQLPLKDVVKLSSGSIVELNRLANEPVEVLINDCVIARGEVVVVDGNYGIRVTEIVSRQERIRSIL